jgi:thymidylate synthase
MIPGELLHTITDAHIYDRHVPIIERMLDREQYPAPKVTLDPAIKNFYDFTPDSFIIENYQAGPQETFEIAI